MEIMVSVILMIHVPWRGINLHMFPPKLSLCLRDCECHLKLVAQKSWWRFFHSLSAYKKTQGITLQSWKCWHLIQMHQTIFKEWKEILFSQILMYIQKDSFLSQKPNIYIFIRILRKKLILLHSLKYCPMHLN